LAIFEIVVMNSHCPAVKAGQGVNFGGGLLVFGGAAATKDS